MIKASSRQFEAQFYIDDFENVQEQDNVDCIAFFKNAHVRETNKSLLYCLSHAYNFAICDFFSRIVFCLIFLYDMMNID